MTKCPECGGDISSTASKCPHCGHDMHGCANSMMSLGCLLTICVTVPVLLLMFGI